MCQVRRRTGEEYGEFWVKTPEEIEGLECLDVGSTIILKFILSRMGRCGMNECVAG
jgi:hypothetical protein